MLLLFTTIGAHAQMGTLLHEQSITARTSPSGTERHPRFRNSALQSDHQASCAKAAVEEPIAMYKTALPKADNIAGFPRI